MNQVGIHLLGYGEAGNGGNIVANEAKLLALGSTAVVGICTDWSGNVYVSDATKHVILKISESGYAQVFAGIAGVSGMANGALGVATFSEPGGLDCDRSGYVYV